jgi:hypothetical protein
MPTFATCVPGDDLNGSPDRLKGQRSPNQRQLIMWLNKNLDQAGPCRPLSHISYKDCFRDGDYHAVDMREQCEWPQELCKNVSIP